MRLHSIRIALSTLTRMNPDELRSMTDWLDRAFPEGVQSHLDTHDNLTIKRR